jgi:hypothetical protein
LWTEDQANGAWGRYQAIGGPYAYALGKSAPAVRWAPITSTWADANGTPAQLVFWVGTDGSVWQNVRTSTWGAPRQVAPPGSAAGPIDATAKMSTHADVVWVTPSGAIAGAWWDAGVNSTYTFILGGTMPHVSSGASTHGAISIILQASGDLSVFWITSSGAVMQIVNDARTNTWLTPVTVATTAAVDSGLAAVTTESLGGPYATGRQHLAWVGPDGTVHTACTDMAWQCYGAAAGQWGTHDLTGPGGAAHDPIAMFSGGPLKADLFWVDPSGDLEHGAWDANNWSLPSAGWSTSQVASYACNTCGEVGSVPCHGNFQSCPSGTSSIAGEACTVCGLYTQQPCNDGGGGASVCNQVGTQPGTDIHTSSLACVCDPTSYRANINTTQFDFYLAPLLNQMSVTAKNNKLTVSIPNGVPIPGGGTSDLSLPAGNSINSLSIPSNLQQGMLWQLDQNAGQIDVTTTLSANITAYFNGLNGAGSCSATVRIDGAPLAIALTADATGAGLQANSVNLGATDPVNMHVDGCSAIQDDVRGEVINQIQGQLQSRLNSMLNKSGVLTTMENTLANQISSNGTGTTLLNQLPTPAPSGSTYSWSCTAIGLGVGQIDGHCSRACVKP